MDDNSSPDLGPLPSVHPNHEMESRSVTAFETLIQGKMIFRREAQRDYGIDGELEIVQNGVATNLRAKVQLKAQLAIKANQDGSFSHGVSCANLNYLLNGPSPIYILYDDTKKEFWYAWAQDELHRLKKDNPDWQRQNSITLKFTARLTPDALPEICERILREGRMLRGLREVVARTPTDEPAKLMVDPSSLNITDGRQAANLLVRSGLTLITAGYPKEALQLFGMLSDDTKGQPRFQMVAGYAEYVCGHYFNAIGHLRQALAKAQDLSIHDRAFLDSVKDTCELACGLIDRATYDRRLQSRQDNLTGALALEARFVSLNRELMEGHGNQRPELLGDIQKTTAALRACSDAAPAAKLGSYLAILYLQGTEFVTDLVRKANKLQAAAQLRDPRLQAMRNASAAAMRAKFAEWETQVHQTYEEAVKLNHPMLVADAGRVRLQVYTFLKFQSAIQAAASGAVADLDTNGTDLLQYFEQIASMYKKIGAAYSRAQVLMLEAEALEIVDQAEQAKQLAIAIRTEAEALQYVDILSRANDLLNGKSLFAVTKRHWQALAAADPEKALAQMTDSQLHDFAAQALELRDLPPNRIETFENYLRQQRYMYQEKYRHCQYLTLLEDKRQTGNPAVAYTALPNRKCVCDKHRYETSIITSDGPALINAFKQQYCTKCHDRAPKAV
jgi:uncharacterized membrane-anchored protein YhcB (DUF1043 family)